MKRADVAPPLAGVLIFNRQAARRPGCWQAVGKPLSSRCQAVGSCCWFNGSLRVTVSRFEAPAGAGLGASWRVLARLVWRTRTHTLSAAPAPTHPLRLEPAGHVGHEPTARLGADVGDFWTTWWRLGSASARANSGSLRDTMIEASFQ